MQSVLYKPLTAKSQETDILQQENPTVELELSESPLHSPEFAELRALAAVDPLLAEIITSFETVTLEQWNSFLVIREGSIFDPAPTTVAAEVVYQITKEYLRNWPGINLSSFVVPDLNLAILLHLNKLKLEQSPGEEITIMNQLEPFYRDLATILRNAPISEQQFSLSLQEASEYKLQLTYTQGSNEREGVLELRLFYPDYGSARRQFLLLASLQTSAGSQLSSFSANQRSSVEIRASRLNLDSLDEFMQQVDQVLFGERILAFVADMDS